MMTQELLQSASQLVKRMEKIVKALLATPNRSFHQLPPDLTRAFPSLIAAYTEDFRAWRAHDDVHVLTRLKVSLLKCYTVCFIVLTLDRRDFLSTLTA